MHRNRVFAAMTMSVALVAVAGTALATPPVNSAVIRPRIFNDCPTSTLTTTNNYPSQITILDENLSCGGFANLHNWRLSSNGTDPAVFDNDSAFRLSADLTISGTADGEGGLQVAPWWSQDVDGRFNVRSTDGEVACFGGRLPFYSFTANDGVVYVKGTTIHLEVTYLANGLSMADPATIEYVVDYNGNHYSSGALAFDEGNPAEDPPYGLWGMLNDGRVGGYVQMFLQGGNPNAAVQADWSNIEFVDLKPLSVEAMNWSKIKVDYR
ncbi:MAG: hypothetical protein R3B81_16960 [bacterium]